MRVPLLGFTALLLIGCSSEDPRLPKQIYDEAVKLNRDGRGLEAKVLMEQLAQRFPDSESGQQARKDVYLIDSFLKRDLAERQRALRGTLKRVTDALIRYRAKRGEYPPVLADLVPEYLEQVPETAWKHPLLYRPYVQTPIQDITGRRGAVTQRFNTKFDGYYLACLGTDAEPGGEGMASDILVKDGELLDMARYKGFVPLPAPQPLR
jgi:hypothetical protein